MKPSHEDAYLWTRNAKAVNVGHKRVAACITVRMKDPVLITKCYHDNIIIAYPNHCYV